MATKGVQVELGGKVRTLKYTLWAVGEIGERLHIKLRLSHLNEDLMGTPLSLRALTTILWAGLIHAEPELTEQQVGEWVDQGNVRDVLNAFFSLFGEQLSETARQSAEQMLGIEATTTVPS